MLTREEVVWGFKYCLGRSPSDEEATGEFTRVQDYKILRDKLFSTPEFISRITQRVRPAARHPFLNYGRPAVVFIHVQKTAGTSLTQMLSQKFEAKRRCPERFNQLSFYPVGELGEFDFFSGHFDYFSTTLIPRREVFRVSFLRRPADRLISFYRFARAHAPNSSLLKDPLFGLAKALEPEAYFANEAIRKSPQINNHYRVVFGGALCGTNTLNYDGAPSGDVISGTVARAVENVNSLQGLGLTHRFEESVGRIFDSLGFARPATPTKAMVTDRMPELNKEATSVPPVKMTAELEAIMADLIEDDLKIFAAGCSEFDRRTA